MKWLVIGRLHLWTSIINLNGVERAVLPPHWAAPEQSPLMFSACTTYNHVFILTPFIDYFKFFMLPVIMRTINVFAMQDSRHCKIQQFSPSGQNKEREKGRTDGSSAESSTAGLAATSSQSLPSFWIPCLTPEAKPTVLKKPVSDFSCHVRSRQWFNSLCCMLIFAHKTTHLSVFTKGGIEFIENTVG